MFARHKLEKEENKQYNDPTVCFSVDLGVIL